MSTFPRYPQPALAAKQAVKIDAVTHWFEKAMRFDPVCPWLLPHGPVGVGKSGLAVACSSETLARLWLRYPDDSNHGEYVKLSMLMRAIRHTYNTKGVDETDVMRPIYEAGWLILDDIGNDDKVL